MKNQKKLWIPIIQGLALVLAFNLCAAVPRVFADQPMENVRAVIDEVMGILRDPAYQAPGQKATRLRLIEQSALRRVDYQEMARRTLEGTWNTISQGQRAEFVRLFTELLKASYADKLDDFAKYKVSYQGETRNGEAAEVRVLILRTNDRIPVRFQLLNRPQGWMIYDMVIEDVSLVDNFRGEFGRVIRATSFASLMKCLQLKLRSNLALRATN